MKQWVGGLVLSGLLISIQTVGLAEPLDLSTLLPPDEKTTEPPTTENSDGSPTMPHSEATPVITDSNGTTSSTTEPIPVEAPVVPEQRGILQMPKAPKTSSIDMPGRGMKKTEVEARFGAPREKTEAVGKPPISSWVYGDFTVYFEHDTALHSVTNNP